MFACNVYISMFASMVSYSSCLAMLFCAFVMCVDIRYVTYIMCMCVYAHLHMFGGYMHMVTGIHYFAIPTLQTHVYV